MPLNLTLQTAGGRIQCPRCQAKSRRTLLQCGSPAERGKRVCRFHGARSTGPRTELGRARCAQARTVHGQETRAARQELSDGMIHLRALEDLAFALGMIDVRTRGRKPGRA
ncbi:MAG: HGGxSTG domain-containing protein [Rubrivivax sp.]